MEMSRLTDKVAIVTGASKGIGAGIAEALGAAGARVAVNYSSDRTGAERVAQTIIDSGGEAIAIGADVSLAADVARLFQEVDTVFGRLDVLVNNAGVFRFGAFAEITEESFHVHCNINVLGAILTVQPGFVQTEHIAGRWGTTRLRSGRADGAENARLCPEWSGYACSKRNGKFFGSNDDADGLDGSGAPKGSNHGVHRDHGHTRKGNS